jgi:hypothetical protein
MRLVWMHEEPQVDWDDLDAATKDAWLRCADVALTRGGCKAGNAS